MKKFKEQRKQNRAGSPATQSPLLEELEPRILFSAEIDGLVGNEPFFHDEALTGTVLEAELLPGAGETAETATQPAESLRRELVFVDPDTPDYQSLVDDLEAQNGEGRRISDPR